MIAQFAFRAPELARWVFLGTLLTGGGTLVLQTVRGMLRGRFAADIVAMLAILGALALGQYFAGAIIALMQSGGEALERYAMGRASQSLEALLARAPKVGHRFRGEQVEDVAVNDLHVGDLLLIRPGDLVPVDGEVTEGVSAVDQSALTGEPLPIRATPGTTLLSGSVNLDGALRMRAVRLAGQSQYQQIVRLVERARRERPPIQRLADRVCEHESLAPQLRRIPLGTTPQARPRTARCAGELRTDRRARLQVPQVWRLGVGRSSGRTPLR